jgi:hypothetical protein
VRSTINAYSNSAQRNENAEYETAVCRCRIELRALARQDPQADPAPGHGRG